MLLDTIISNAPDALVVLAKIAPTRKDDENLRDQTFMVGRYRQLATSEVVRCCFLGCGGNISRENPNSHQRVDVLLSENRPLKGQG
ncbi:MAG TPA: hypothetical protein VHW01_01985 [Polyangiaceae bacterium]|jgi:hypothetical protein|nr:hypothetical protein [Polyangiaceae bacterium]